MSVLVKGMKMPKACCECGFNHCSQSRDDDTCELLNKGIPQLFVLADRLPDCPLVEVPCGVMPRDAEIEVVRKASEDDA